MDFFDRHKALILSTLFCSVVLLGLYNFGLSEKKKKENEMLVDLENYLPEELKEDQPDKEKEAEAAPTPKAQTHRAFNQNQQAREENFNRELEDIFERNSAAREETSENQTQTSASGNYNLGKESNQKNKASDGNNSSQNTSRQNGGLRNSSISFSLRGRSAVSIPNPIYTCDRAGKVVVNIKVNSEGRVINTAINSASSSTANECLTEKALEYAQTAVFSKLPGRNQQPGTISYNFKP